MPVRNCTIKVDRGRVGRFFFNPKAANSIVESGPAAFSPFKKRNTDGFLIMPSEEQNFFSKMVNKRTKEI